MDNPYHKADTRDTQYERIEIERLKSQERLQAKELEFKDKQAKREADLKFRTERRAAFIGAYDRNESLAFSLVIFALTLFILGMVASITLIHHFW